MSDAIERARMVLSNIDEPESSDAHRLEWLLDDVYPLAVAMLDCLEAISPPWGTSDYKEILDLHTKAREKFEEAINE